MIKIKSNFLFIINYLFYLLYDISLKFLLKYLNQRIKLTKKFNYLKIFIY